jgi:hypothetical protein
MISISTTQHVNEEREPLFSIDGTEYTIPVEVPPAMGLEAMEKTRTEGEAPATAWIMRELLGVEGWKALRECKQVNRAQMAAIMQVCRDRVFGGMEEEGKG